MPDDGIKAAVLGAFQRSRGAPRSRWHTQSIYLEAVSDRPGGWIVDVVIVEDLDNCSQYDRSAEWAGAVEVSSGLEVRGVLKLVVVGVAYGASVGTAVALPGT